MLKFICGHHGMNRCDYWALPSACPDRTAGQGKLATPFFFFGTKLGYTTTQAGVKLSWGIRHFIVFEKICQMRARRDERERERCLVGVGGASAMLQKLMLLMPIKRTRRKIKIKGGPWTHCSSIAVAQLHISTAQPTAHP